MDVAVSRLEDMPGWMELAREVEPLFGPMAGDPGFQAGLRQAILEQRAFCIREAGSKLAGGVVIATAENEIAWLAVNQGMRGRGLGEALLKRALAGLRPEAPVWVTTFAPSVPAGMPARALYLKFSFKDAQEAGVNPAGIPIVVMRRDPD